MNILLVIVTLAGITGLNGQLNDERGILPLSRVEGSVQDLLSSEFLPSQELQTGTSRLIKPIPPPRQGESYGEHSFPTYFNPKHFSRSGYHRLQNFDNLNSIIDKRSAGYTNGMLFVPRLGKRESPMKY